MFWNDQWVRFANSLSVAQWDSCALVSFNFCCGVGPFNGNPESINPWILSRGCPTLKGHMGFLRRGIEFSTPLHGSAGSISPGSFINKVTIHQRTWLFDTTPNWGSTSAGRTPKNRETGVPSVAFEQGDRRCLE